MWLKLSDVNKPYVVTAGDTLSRIAVNSGVTLKDILSANPGIANPDYIRVGQKLNIPAATQSTPPTPVPVLSERDKLIKALKVNEGFRGNTYLDTSGVPTIGYGTTRQSPGAIEYINSIGMSPDNIWGPKAVGTVTELQGLALMNKALDHNAGLLKSGYPGYPQFSENQRLALQDMMYQMGPKGLGKFTNMNKAINVQDPSKVDWTSVASHAADSKWAKTQTPNRAKRVISLFNQ